MSANDLSQFYSKYVTCPCGCGWTFQIIQGYPRDEVEAKLPLIVQLQMKFDARERNLDEREASMDSEFNDFCDSYARDKNIEFNNRLFERFRVQEDLFEKRLSASLYRSMACRGGNIFERLAVLSPDYPLNPADAFALIGKPPIDIISFNGLAEKRVNSVTFIEVKTETSCLNEIQKQIKCKVDAHNVNFLEFRPDESVYKISREIQIVPNIVSQKEVISMRPIAGEACPHCGCLELWKAGFVHGKQRYQCKSCWRYST